MEIRRRFARWKVNLPARIRLAGAVRFVNCSIDDISLMGVKVSLPLKLTEDKFLKLTLALSDSFVLNIEAWVGWHKTSDVVNIYGLYFTRISDEDKEKIYRYLHANHREALEKAWWQDTGTEEKEAPEPQDKRIFQRFVVNLPMRFLDSNSGKEAVAITHDISAKGVGILSKEELKIRAPLEIWLQVQDSGEPIYTRGEVIWSGAEGSGEFRAGINLEKADLMGLSRILRS